MNADEFELILFDRIEIIKTANKKYDIENNGYISFSGGKDSTILHYLIDIALPNNKIPRVYIDTGIEYQDIRKFVMDLASNDDRIIIIKPTKPIKPTLEKYGYPFKSKEHSNKLYEFQIGHRNTKSNLKYRNFGERYACPKILAYQFSDDFKLNISHLCCKKMKKEPASKWEKENHKTIVLTGMRKEEGGQRANLKGCILTHNGKTKFHPLLVVDEEWENEFIKRNNIKLCKLYYPPYNFKRTGCAGCPFALRLQDQLDVMERYLPNQKKQCETIWKPVYDEYRKIHYRLRGEGDYKQLNLFEEGEQEQ